MYAQYIVETSICPICDNSYSQRSALYQHIEEVHGDVGYLSCYNCGEELNSEREFKVHLNDCKEKL